MNSLSLLISAITPIDSVASPSDINVHMMLVLSPEFQEWELIPMSNLITWSLGWHGLEQPAIQLHTSNLSQTQIFLSISQDTDLYPNSLARIRLRWNGDDRSISTPSCWLSSSPTCKQMELSRSKLSLRSLTSRPDKQTPDQTSYGIQPTNPLSSGIQAH